MSSKKSITLRTSDQVTVEVAEEVALESQTIKHMIEDDCADSEIPVPNVTSEILAKVIEYCKAHVEFYKANNEFSRDDNELPEFLKKFNKEFMDKFDVYDTLFDLILAANYLNIKGLLDLTCQTVAEMIKEKTVEEVREIFHIENDFTPEEEAKVRAEHPWVFGEEDEVPDENQGASEEEAEFREENEGASEEEFEIRGLFEEEAEVCEENQGAFEEEAEVREDNQGAFEEEAEVREDNQGAFKE